MRSPCPLGKSRFHHCHGTCSASLLWCPRWPPLTAKWPSSSRRWAFRCKELPSRRYTGGAPGQNGQITHWNQVNMVIYIYISIYIYNYILNYVCIYIYVYMVYVWEFSSWSSIFHGLMRFLFAMIPFGSRTWLVRNSQKVRCTCWNWMELRCVWK